MSNLISFISLRIILTLTGAISMFIPVAFAYGLRQNSLPVGFIMSAKIVWNGLG